MCVEQIHEIINFENQLHMKIFMHKVSNVQKHWHQCSEIIFVLDGKLEYRQNDESFTLNEDDIILINPNDLHSIYSAEGAILLALQVDFSLLKSSGIDKNLLFSVNSSIVEDPSVYNPIISVLAKLIKLSTNLSAGFADVMSESLLLKLYFELATKFKAYNDEDYMKRRKQNHFMDVVNYIRTNSRLPLTVSELSSKFHFSPSYLCKQFKNTMGITLKKYIDDIRFSDALEELIATDLSIDQIALDCGFYNSRTFVTMFKQKYNCLPSDYRKNLSIQKKHNPKVDGKINYLGFEQTKYLVKLSKYLTADGNLEAIPQESQQIYVSNADVSIRGTSLIKTYKNFITVARASDILLEEIQAELREVQNKIGFKYIKFHGLFDDDLFVYYKNYDEEEIINFSNLDKIFDFLKSVNLLPLVQFSFMPRVIAKYPDRTIFSKPFIISEPKNISKWQNLIREFLKHYSVKYGLKEIRNWLYCLWNEPETNINMFGFSDIKEYYKLFKATYKEVKDFDIKLKFGSSSNIYHTIINTDWLQDFLKACPNCPLDFVNIHFYALESDNSVPKNAQWAPSLSLTKQPNLMAISINRIKEKLTECNLANIPLYLTEWNSTTSHRDLLNDTTFKSAYIVKNIIDNFESLDSFGYWCLSDFNGELPHRSDIFYGGLGMYANGGIKKTPFFAFEFLNSLGSIFIKKGKDYIVTKNSDGDIVILMHNYIHYSDIYASGDVFDMTYNNRYTPFTTPVVKNYNIRLNNIESGRYEIQEKILNRKHGSAFDKWNECFPENRELNKEEIEYLKETVQPYQKRYFTIITESIYDCIAHMEPHEVRLIKLKKMNF